MRTPNAVIGVIGTDFYVAYANGRTTIICFEGTLTVTPGPGAKVVGSNNSSDGAEQPIPVLAGQVVVIGMKPLGSALQEYSTLRTASLKDTDVSETHRGHTGRTITLVAMGVIAGLTIGLTQINSSSKPCGCK